MRIILRIMYLGGVLVWSLYVLLGPTWSGRFYNLDSHRPTLLRRGGVFGLRGASSLEAAAPVWEPPTAHSGAIHATVRWPWQPASKHEHVEIALVHTATRLALGLIVLGVVVNAVNWLIPCGSQFIPAVSRRVSLALAVVLLIYLAMSVTPLVFMLDDIESLIVAAYALAAVFGLASGIRSGRATLPTRSQRAITNRRQSQRFLCVGLCLVVGVAIVAGHMLWRNALQSKNRKEAIAWIDAQGGTASYPSGPKHWPAVSFRATAIDDESLAAVTERLIPLGAIWELDLRDTRVTGRKLAALSSLTHVHRMVLSPRQINRVSITQLNQCDIAFLMLSGDISEADIMDLVPVFRQWKGRLALDGISPDGLKRLKAGAPNLRGVYTAADDTWHPIADAWGGAG